MYLSYTEYLHMGGKLPEIEFEHFEFQAESEIDYATFSRLKNEETIPVAVKRLTFYIIYLMEKKAAAFSLGRGPDADNAFITSQSNDGVSVSYNGLEPSDLITLCKTDALNAIRSYLDGVTNSAGHKLLYRGVYPGE